MQKPNSNFSELAVTSHMRVFFSTREMMTIIPFSFPHIYMYACFQGLKHTYSKILIPEMMCRFLLNAQITQGVFCNASDNLLCNNIQTKQYSPY